MFGPMKRVSKSTPRWSVRRIVGNKAREICGLEAKDAEAAIKRTIREMGISDRHQQSRLAARPVA
jgi:hypothetical protein